MTDFAPLGFQIDTAALLEAMTAAAKAVADFDRLSISADKIATSSKRKSEALRAAADEAKKAAEAAKQAGSSEAAALEQTAQASEKAAKRATETARAKTEESAAIRKAAEAAKAEAEAADKAHEAAVRAAGGKRDLADKAARATEQIRALSEHANAMATRLQGATMAAQGLAGGLGTGGVGGITSVATGAASAISRLLVPLGGLASSIGLAAAAAVAFGTAYAGAMAYLAPFEDKMTRLEGRMRNVFGGSTSLSSSMLSSIRAMSQDTGLGFESTSDSFLRQARNKSDIGATSGEILQLVELTQKLGVVSGASRGEIASGTLQLSQSLAAGRLNGDELRSIMENMPALAKAIADGLNVSVGQLRNMGAEGQLTSDKVFAAILSQTEKIRKEFASLPETVEQATTRLGDSFDRLFANLGKRANASATVQAIVNFANNQVKQLADDTEVSPERVAAVRAERLEKAISEASVLLEKARARQSEGAHWYDGLGGQSYLDDAVSSQAARREAMMQELRTIRAQQFRAAENASMEALGEGDVRKSASVSRGLKIADETLQIAAKQKETTTSTQTLTSAIDALKATSDKYTPEEFAKKMATLTSALTSVRAQADAAKDSFAKLQEETTKLKAAQSRYGSTGADTGLEVDKIIEGAARDGRTVERAEAELQVITDRLLKGSVAAGKETAALLQLRDEVQAATKGQEELTRVQAEHRKAVELGDMAAATAAGEAQIRQSGIDAVERRRLEALQKQRLNAEQEAREIQSLKDQVIAARRGREDLARVQAEQRASDALGSGADTADISAAGRRAVEKMQQEQKLRDAQSEFTPEPRSTGDVRRTMDDLRRSIDDLNAMAGMDSAGRTARQFETSLAKELETIPADMRAAYEMLKRTEFDAQRGVGAADFVRGYEERLRQTREQAELEGLVGQQRRIAVELLRAEQQLRSQGITLTEEQRSRLTHVVTAQVKLNDEMERSRQLSDDMRAAIGNAGRSIQQTFGDAVGEAAVSGNNAGEAFANGMKSALKRLISDMFNAITQPLIDEIFGKRSSGGWEGGLLGSLFRPSGRQPAASGAASAVSGARPIDLTAGTRVESVGPYSGLLSSISVTGKASSVSKLNPEFRDSLGRMVSDAQDKFGKDAVTLTSGFRSVEDQAKLWEQAVNKYGSPEKARKWVAPPGMSRHNAGAAADLEYSSSDVKKWMHENASSYGLKYRMSNEDWHIEPAGSREGQSAIDRMASSATRADMSIGRLGDQSTSASQSILNLSNGVGSAGRDLTASAGGIGSAGKDLENSTSELASGTKGAFSSLLGGLGSGIDGLLSGLGNIVSKVAGGGFSAIGNIFGGLFGGLFGGSASAATATPTMGGLYDVGGWTGNGPAHAIAGAVHGQEFVVRAGPAARHRQILEQINREQSPPGYASGGWVGTPPAMAAMAATPVPNSASVPTIHQTIINNTRAEVSTAEEPDGRGGRRQVVVIEEAVGQALSRPGSAARRDLGRAFGVKTGVVRR